ncbi:PREDICTED: endoplasmic reticulum metallopeptidase 1-like [Nicrophorus vespilloides]|uniref:Endoplasmic reticulum metallopeptidase 1-like n=1 Tax=Nicrophorus vespilloides TaxID=110193 RepID=A0ABM1NEV2_NICVS|nr:PREDICTED: endoplasmic reticulum metallopeptidase 1-like [Nicrophorus vespilloides]
MARYLKYLLMVLSGTCVIFIIVACAAFIPYDENSSTPVLQRYWMFHSSRTVRDDSNTVIKKDNGFSFYNMDRNSPIILEDYIGDYLDKAESLVDDCRDILYCGLPVLFTESNENLEKYIWIPTETEPKIDKVDLMLTSIEYFNSGKEIFMKYCFKTYGTDHYNIYFSPRENIMLKKIDLLETVPTNQPKWNGRETYFILYVDGKERKALEFCMDLESVNGEFGRVNLDIAIAGTYYNEKVVQKSDEYREFLSKFPKWTSLNAWSGSYESWVY